MSKIILQNVQSGYNLSRINQNFQTIKQFIEANVLCRDVPVGEPNSMEQELDMNGNNIINLNFLILTAPNGTRYKLSVNNDGEVNAETYEP